MRVASLLAFCACFGLSASAASKSGFDKASCTFNGKKLSGNIRFVTAFEDVRVRVVTAFPDLRVKKVTGIANDCGEWRIVDSLPDLKVRQVDSFPDLKIEYVQSFPGVP